jgi:nitric oxide reductase NorD protein
VESLSPEAITQRLEEDLEVEFSFRIVTPAAEQIALLPPQQQHFILDMVHRLASTQIEIAFQFALRAADALALMEPEAVAAWGLHAADIYDRQGLMPGLQILRNLDQFRLTRSDRAAAALLESHLGVLTPFVQGLAGRRLRLAEGSAATTDSETIYLPAVIAEFASREQNYRLYKALAVMQWAIVRYGSLRPLQQLTEEPEADWIALYHSCETLRLRAIIARELPGLFRELEALDRAAATESLATEWQAVADLLADPASSAELSLTLTRRYHRQLTPGACRCYQGQIDLAAVRSVMAKRIAREKARLRVTLSELAAPPEENPADSHQELTENSPPRFSLREVEDANALDGVALEIMLDDQPVAPPEGIDQLITSIRLDLGGIPPDYLVAAGPGEYDPRDYADTSLDPESVWSGTYHEEGAFFYNEWDYQRQSYRKNWCVVRERTLAAGDPAFVAATRIKYADLLRQLRRSFEAMRDEDRLLKRQLDGEEIDIDALVEAHADRIAGRELSDRLYARMQRSERNIAVAFMVDMSGSTRGWINEAEREALILLCEALEMLGDRYAIYGFSGMTRKGCELYPIKRINEPYSREIEGRIAAIEPRDYTRMGFAIRHLSQLLTQVDARTRLLITLSDGKPDDYNDYRGEYGIEDTRRALIEARHAGIHPYCITIDRSGPDYLPHMYGPVSYTVLDEVRLLPLKVGEIYRRLTRR